MLDHRRSPGSLTHSLSLPPLLFHQGLIQLSFEGPVRMLYRIGTTLAPRWVWLCCFLLADFWFIYYLCYLAFSLLGLLVSVKFFAFHVLDLATRIRLLNYVMQSVTVNGGQVLATLLLGVLLCYIFAVVGQSASHSLRASFTPARFQSSSTHHKRDSLHVFDDRNGGRSELRLGFVRVRRRGWQLDVSGRQRVAAPGLRLERAPRHGGRALTAQVPLRHRVKKSERGGR